MSIDFSKLKKSSGNLDKLTKAIEALNTNTDNDSKEKFWRPEVDKAGNGMATIRFLPAPGQDGEDGLPWVKVFSHGFQGPGGWLIDNCLTTKNQQCPVCEHNSTLWNSGIEANKEIVRKQKRKLNYVANVYIVSDPKHPENEGKVFLFKFGKKIFDMIMDKARPAFEDEDPVNVFDYWEGANFKLRMKTVDRFPNYDSSTWEAPAPIYDNDEGILAVANAQYKLAEFTAAANFKSYDELKQRLDATLTGAPMAAKAVDVGSSEDDNNPLCYQFPCWSLNVNTLINHPRIPLLSHCLLDWTIHANVHRLTQPRAATWNVNNLYSKRTNLYTNSWHHMHAI